MSTTQIPFAIELPAPETFDYQSNFEDPSLYEQALKTTAELFASCRQLLNTRLDQAINLSDFFAQCCTILGKKKANAAFHDWLADQFGKSGHIPKGVFQIGQWFSKLPSDVRELVREFIQDWSLSALKKLIKVPIDYLIDLAIEGKLTPTAIKELVASLSNKERRLRVNGYAEVVLNYHELKSQVGRVVSKDKSGNVILEMSGGKFSFKVEDLKAVAKPRGFQAATNSVTQESNQAQSQIDALSKIIESQKLIIESQKNQLEEYANTATPDLSHKSSQAQSQTDALSEIIGAQQLTMSQKNQPGKYENTATSIADSNDLQVFTQAEVDLQIAKAISEYERKKTEEYTLQLQQFKAAIFEEVKAAAFEEIRATIFEEVRSTVESAKNKEIHALTEKNDKLNQQLQQIVQLESAHSRRFQALEAENQKLRQSIQNMKHSDPSINNWSVKYQLDAIDNPQVQLENQVNLAKLDAHQLQLNSSVAKALSKEQMEEIKAEFLAQSHREIETLQREIRQLKQENDALKFQALAPNVKEFERYVLNRSGRHSTNGSPINARTL